MKVLTGDEHLKFDGMPINRLLSDFWRWHSSDLLNNTLRGAFAEFIVSTALDIDLTTSHIDWEAYDIRGGGGERIEVKCGAYLQSWQPKNAPDRLSKILFSISPALYWISDECRYLPDSYERHSDVYVFCHYTAKERAPENPLNLDYWDFYVLATKKIDKIFGNQKSISLNTLVKRGYPTRCRYDGIKDAIAKEYADNVALSKIE